MGTDVTSTSGNRSNGESIRVALDRIEKDLADVAALLPKTCPGAPKLRSPYTVSEAVNLDEIEKKAAAKASSVRFLCV
jgi:hypothetical protein